MSVALTPSYRFFYQGSPVADGTVNVYQSGTTTPVDIYTDAALTTPASNPVTLDANGEAQFYVSDSSNLRFDVYTAGDAFVESLDPVYPSTTTTATASTYSGGGGFLNKFRNGNMDIWQRGTSGTITAGTPAYTADGWIVSSTGADIAWSQGSPGDGCSHSLTLTGASSVTDAYVKQRIEGSIAEQLLQNSENITVQFTVANSTGGSLTPTLTVKHPSSLDSWDTTTTDVDGVSLQSIASGQTATVAYTFTSNSGMADGLEVTLDFGSALNSGSKNVSVYGADIRIAPDASTGLNGSPPAVELRPFPAELAFCQRYLYVYNAVSTFEYVGSGQCISSTSTIFVFRFPVPLRAKPTGLTVSKASHFGQTASTGGNTALTNLTLTSPGTTSSGLTSTVASGLSSGNASMLYSNNASAQLIFTGAEL